MSTEVEEVTADVFIVKVAAEKVDGTVTDEPPGKVATPLELVSITTAPPAGAGPFRITVPVEELPPWTVLGERLRSKSCGLTVTVRTAVTVTPLGVPVIVAEMMTLRSEAGTGVVVVMVKVAEADGPTVTVVPPGKVTLESELARVTVPPVVSFKVTVPVAVTPPMTLCGSTVRETGNRVTPIRAVETRSPRPS